jgi:two-component system phosphate regulon sensor histidine kinase PhoR
MPRGGLYWRLWPYSLAGAACAATAAIWIDRGVGGWGAKLCWLVPVVCLAAAVAPLVARHMVRGTVEALRSALAACSEGEPRLASRPSLAEADPLHSDLMATVRSLHARLEAVLRENHEQQAVLASMVEGVLAVDTDKRVISLNQAAARLLGTKAAQVEGRLLQEGVRHAELQRFVVAALSSERPIEGCMMLHPLSDRLVQATGTPLRDKHGRALGAVIVLNDISRLRQLENLRRDFAANVSHELKTPITSIKGFVETLLDGGLHNPQDAERFLRIVLRQADRLNTIIDDLLMLARIEKESETGDIALAPGRLLEVLQAALHEYEGKAAERQISLKLQCEESLLANINPALLQQAVMNLLDNAIKYSEPGADVELSAVPQDGRVLIRVRDQGCGIAPEHHARLFERFYRVDKARSRKLGGTGLGLAIVKHIVLAHAGEVAVESAPGRGSTFTISLPACKLPAGKLQWG